ncbi:diguanylate cyclase domain-containing protein [Roseateles puraquae]|uniref:Sensor domain-containing diguanylate cyclase n=1 Tax=Roseateles puraquae TaxID=431059 RepID=A0A254N5X9_9BURK|nr:diguanylate cyclase [Roseateles puraquae]MDG0853119.1 diguanylate cyclase [Roseateles puraquae]OWR02232.1 sensor domain-containing diguanylate cyclase [Roseateles puraquae]
MSLRTLTARLPLRRLLTLPYVALILALVLLVGALSWRAGRDTVDSLSGQLIGEAVSRIQVSLERHLSGADTVLEAAFPTGLPAPDSIAQDLDALRTRFWLATSVHRDPNNYVYYGDRHGHFLGLWRFSEQEAELRLRTAAEGPRTLYRLSGIRGEPRSPTAEDKVFEPRDRPWYQSALASPAALRWTPVYIDFKTADLVVTRTKRIGNDVGEPEGVAATDLPLKQLNALLQGLALTEHAVAMVVEADGQLVAVSRGAHIRSLPSGERERLNAAQSPDTLVASAYAAARNRLAAAPGELGTAPRSSRFDDAEGRRIQLGFSHVAPALGLDWLVIVAVPQADFLAGVQRNFVQAALLAGVGVVTALGLGWAVLGVVTRELRELADAARRVGDGILDEPPEVSRQDELGDLARSFADMQRRLLTDQLTGLSNRSAILRRIEDRVLQQRRRGDHWPFAVMFVDLARIKEVNKRFGHAVGDEVLREVGQRLRAGVRIGDVVARYAGDEFVLLLESVENRADAEAARRHLEASLREPLAALAGVAPADFVIGASFGIALYPDDGLDTETLLRHADADMYARRQQTDSPEPPDATLP